MKAGLRAVHALKRAAALLLATGLCFPAFAQDTLDKLRQSGEITIGYQDAAFPFSYYDNRHQVVGYAMDLCHRIVDAIRNSLPLKTLQIKRNPALFANRMSLLSQGTIDLDCGPALITGETGEKTKFSLPYFVADIRFLSRKSAGLRRVDDLKGKPVISVFGTRAQRETIALNRLRQLGMSVGVAKNSRQAFQAVATGNIAALFMDDVTIHTLVSESGNRGEWAISEETLASESYGLMLRRDDSKLAKIVDDALRDLYRSGELHRIYEKWFLGPVRTSDGTTVSLGLPMAEALGRAMSPTLNTDKAQKR